MDMSKTTVAIYHIPTKKYYASWEDARAIMGVTEYRKAERHNQFIKITEDKILKSDQ